MGSFSRKVIRLVCAFAINKLANPPAITTVDAFCKQQKHLTLAPGNSRNSITSKPDFLNITWRSNTPTLLPYARHRNNSYPGAVSGASGAPWALSARNL